MGKDYDLHERSRGFTVVSEPDPRVVELPEPGEGEILDVDFEFAYTIGGRLWRRCQVCPRTFQYCEAHVNVRVYLEGIRTEFGNFVTAMFCSRERWSDWASAEELRGPAPGQECSSCTNENHPIYRSSCNQGLPIVFGWTTSRSRPNFGSPSFVSTMR